MKTLIVTIRVAADVDAVTLSEWAPLDTLREYGAAEVCHSELVNGPLDKVSTKSLQRLPRARKVRT